MSSVSYQEYRPELAKAIAEMWNRCSSGWNGMNFYSSEEKVLHEEGESSHLNIYLAVQDELVIGYAKLATSDTEPGIAYIQMLSVDPPFHGKGIGKELVQRCVLRAAELGYNRIDLFTWAGNTKAVPLYKKCGFFWENMEVQATHLMNFLPGLLNNELLKPYFEVFHWYDDAVRDLSIEPDGRDENGFAIYDYLWEKDGKRLQVSFERQGRGIVKICTEDFEVYSMADNPKPVFGGSHAVSYHINIPGSKACEISLQGADDGVVKHKLDFQTSFCGSKELPSSYEIEPIETECNEWQTCPGVAATFFWQGKSIGLKTGLRIQYPLQVQLRNCETLITPGRLSTMYLNLESKFAMGCRFLIEFPQDELIELEKSVFDVYLEAHARSFIPLSFTAKAGCIYNPLLKITAIPEGGKALEYSRSECVVLGCPSSKDQQITRNYCYLLNGLNSFTYDKKDNKNFAYFQTTYGNSFYLYTPAVGKPYSQEFRFEQPYDAEVKDLGYANQLLVFHRSKEIMGLEFARVFTLYPSGLLELQIRIIKLPQHEEDLWFKQSIYMPTNNLSFAHKGRLMKLESDMPDRDSLSFGTESIPENWLYSATDDTTYSVIWAAPWQAMFDEWRINWELNLSECLRQGTRDTAPIQMYLDVFKNAYQTRNAALHQRHESKPLYPSLELSINKANPFITHAFEVELKQHEDSSLHGTFSLKPDSLMAETKTLSLEEDKRSVDWLIADKAIKPLEIIRCQMDLPLYSVERGLLAFKPQGKVSFAEEGQERRADNGVLQISSAQDAKLPGLISLKYQGREWLDRAYPDYLPKSSYNPYPGGMSFSPAWVPMKAVQKESHKLDKCSLIDQWDNTWEGLSFTTEILKFEAQKGLQYRQSFVMLPGIPVLAIVVEILRGTGKADYCAFSLGSFFKPDENLQSCYMEAKDDKKDWYSFRAGAEALHLQESFRQLAVRCEAANTRLNIISMAKLQNYLHLDPSIMRSRSHIWSEITNSMPMWLEPMFVVFTEERLQHEWAYPLLETRFRH